jgi:hypothetical protein
VSILVWQRVNLAPTTTTSNPHVSPCLMSECPTSATYHHVLDSQHVRGSRATVSVRSGRKSAQTTITRRKGRLRTRTSNARVVGSADVSSRGATHQVIQPSPGQLRSSSHPPVFPDEFPSEWSLGDFPSDNVEDDSAHQHNVTPANNIQIQLAKRTRVRSRSSYSTCFADREKGVGFRTVVTT